MEGCDNFCSYCTVPYLRGREVSRNVRSIIDEVHSLVASGVKEVVLLGQNVNSYRDNTGEKQVTLYELLSMLNDIKGLERIRFITSHPKDLTDKLMHAFTDFDTVCPHIHLPIQSGSDRILKLMARGYTVEEYMDKINKIRAMKPDIAVTSDFIAGFPSENAQDHHDTIMFVRRANYDNIFSFKYSDRPLARANKYGDKVPEQTIAGRLRELQDAQLEITREIYRALTGTVQRVLVEGDSKKQGRQQGRTMHGRLVNFSGTVPEGTVADVLIDDYSDNALYGKHVPEEE
jgi:tRNA-2-methylthio-N6-dimethylallyladenosine synthase